MKDYYKILGVDTNTSYDEIKKAYRKLAHQYHPDKGGGDEAKFKEINEAYQVLSDQSKRNQYDRLRAFGAGQASPFGFDFGPFDFSRTGWGTFEDLLGEFFGGFSGVHTGTRTRATPRQTIAFTFRGPGGITLRLEIENSGNLTPRTKQLIEEFAEKIFESLAGGK